MSDDNLKLQEIFYIGIEKTDYDTEPTAKRFASIEDEEVTIALSQPVTATVTPHDLKSLLQNTSESKLICFSQPTHNDDLILGSIVFINTHSNHMHS